MDEERMEPVAEVEYGNTGSTAAPDKRLKWHRHIYDIPVGTKLYTHPTDAGLAQRLREHLKAKPKDKGFLEWVAEAEDLLREAAAKLEGKL